MAYTFKYRGFTVTEETAGREDKPLTYTIRRTGKERAQTAAACIVLAPFVAVLATLAAQLLGWAAGWLL